MAGEVARTFQPALRAVRAVGAARALGLDVRGNDRILPVGTEVDRVPPEKVRGKAKARLAAQNGGARGRVPCCGS